MGMGAARIVLGSTGVLLLVAAAVLWCVYRARHARLRRFAREVTCGCSAPREIAMALARRLYFDVRRGPNPRFISPLLSPLGASPLAVLNRGGCCSGIHGLFIAALETLGIRAAQITVYGQGPAAVHCLAQVSLAGSPPLAHLIIDVDYGCWYRHADGTPLSLAQLRAGAIPVVEPFILDAGALRIERHFRTPPGYPKTQYFNFDFRATRTANWNETRTRRLAYVLLWHLTRGRIDTLLLPPALEWPELILAAALGVLGVGLVTLAALQLPALA